MTVTYIEAMGRAEGLELHKSFMAVSGMTYSIALALEGMQEVVTPKGRFASIREIVTAINTETKQGRGLGTIGVAGPDFLSCHFSAGAHDPLRKFLRGLLPCDNAVQVSGQTKGWIRSVIDWANQENRMAGVQARLTHQSYVPQIRLHMIGGTQPSFQIVFPDLLALDDYEAQQRQGNFRHSRDYQIDMFADMDRQP